MINIFWPHNNINGISDQLFCLEKLLNFHNVPYTFSTKLDLISHNIVIENIEDANYEYITNFCKLHKIKISILVTEFLTYERNMVSINNRSLTQKHIFFERFNNLLHLNEHISSVLSLGFQPDLIPYARFLNAPNIFSLGMATLTPIRPNKSTESHDLYFSGAWTPYREQIINEISNSGISVLTEFDFVEINTRESQLSSCSFNLNIPQDANWKWLSPMRVLFGAIHGKKTISYRTNYDPNLADLSLVWDTIPSRPEFLFIENQIHKHSLSFNSEMPNYLNHIGKL